MTLGENISLNFRIKMFINLYFAFSQTVKRLTIKNKEKLY